MKPAMKRTQQDFIAILIMTEVNPAYLEQM
jgi:hypothetical protein